MISKNKEPFNPFEYDENLVESDILLNEVLSHIIEHFKSVFGFEADPESDYEPMHEEMSFLQFYINYEQFLKFDEIFKNRGLDNITAELADELVLFSLLPFYYNQLRKERIKHLLKSTKGIVNLYALKKNIELGKGKSAEIRFPDMVDFQGAKINLGVFFGAMILNNSNEKVYRLLEKRVSQVNRDLNPEEQANHFIDDLRILFKIFGVIERNLPPKSVFESLIVQHLYFIIRQEQLIREINTDTKTDVKITRFIVDLFRAGGYYLEDTEQDQETMVNNAYHRKSNKNWQNKIKNKLAVIS